MDLKRTAMFRFSKFLLIGMIAAACFGVGFFQKFYELLVIPPQIGHFSTCPAPLSGNREVLNVYLTETAFAQSMQEQLCNNPVVKRQFGNVHLVVGQNDYDTFRYINHGVSDLALVKSNVVEAFSANQIYDYHEIAAHASYSAYFISLREKPVLSKEYLLGKKIGLLDYPSSRSGNIVPKTVLQSLGLNDTNVNIQYYSSHQELRRALLDGEVDIISSYWAVDDNTRLSRNYITALEDNVSGMRWYLKMQKRNTDLRCALQNVIENATRTVDKRYYQQVEIIDRCSHETN